MCRENLEALSRAMDEYLADNDETYPSADRWCDALVAYLPGHGSFVCPSARNRQCGYAFSELLGGRKADSIADPSGTIMLFESDRGWNASGGRELLPKEPRHIGGENYGFSDGSVRWYPRSKAKELQWRPVLKEPVEGAKPRNAKAKREGRE